MREKRKVSALLSLLYGRAPSNQPPEPLDITSPTLPQSHMYTQTIVLAVSVCLTPDYEVFNF